PPRSRSNREAATGVTRRWAARPPPGCPAGRRSPGRPPPRARPSAEPRAPRRAGRSGRRAPCVHGPRCTLAAVFVTFLSDYGRSDDFVGVCHAVIARIAPEVRVIDLTHDVPRHDVRSAAVILRRALPFCPAGVHMVVVDPGVGGTRRAIAVRVAEEDRILVGPDNGVLWPAAERLGGVVEAVDVAR